MTAAQHSPVSYFNATARFAAIAMTLALGACASGGSSDMNLALGGEKEPPRMTGGTEMGKALNYWGHKYMQKPTDKVAALNYARNLKAAGHNKQAFQVYQHASAIHGNDREIASEYGRLALEEDQIQLAEKLLALADDHSSPDWRIVSGRGAALAKLGRYGEAVTMFERAHKLAPSNPTVLNNLAMAHAGNRNLQEAERLLRQAAENPMAKDKVATNLALVLRLQGRDAEANLLGSGQPIAAAASPISTASISAVEPVSPEALKQADQAAQKVGKRVRRTSASNAIRKSVTPERMSEPLPPIVARSTLR